MGSTYRTAIMPFIPEFAMPLVRTAYYSLKGTSADLRARLRPTPQADTAPIFIIGCGRSGTTLLGEIFSMHPKVKYIYEPYDLWAAIEPLTDFLQLYSKGEHHCLLGGKAVTEQARTRFRRLMSSRPGVTLVEKSPVNALRIGYVDAIAPRARFVHIVRDGIQAARSIEQMASITRRMAFRPSLNDWWGVDSVKWSALKRDGIAAGYYADEVSQLVTDQERGAYEWLVSIREVSAWRARLGDRLVELRLEDLISDPRKALEVLVDQLDAGLTDEGWLDQAAKMVRPTTKEYDSELILPEHICRDLNIFQETYDFKGRAFSINQRSSLG